MGDETKTTKDQQPIEASKNNLQVNEPSADLIDPTAPDGSQEILQKIHTASEDNKPVDDVISYECLKDETKTQIGTSHGTIEEKSQKPHLDGIVESAVSVDAKEETVSDNETGVVAKGSKDASPVGNEDKKPRLGSAASALNPSERIVRNQSDIFSLKEQTSIASSIFSVNGSPSRKVYRNRELSPSNVFPFGQNFSEPHSEDPVSSPRDRLRQGKDNYNDIKRPSSSIRNPLTGTGLNSNDEYKFKGSKRKDGNPLLGLGYTPEVTPSTHRIPPGGYSHKLW